VRRALKRDEEDSQLLLHSSPQHLPGILIMMASDQEDLIEKLDALLERYLEVLDEYEKARQELSSSMSSVSSSLYGTEMK
jgi:hypothetical protein